MPVPRSRCTDSPSLLLCGTHVPLAAFLVVVNARIPPAMGSSLPTRSSSVVTVHASSWAPAPSHLPSAQGAEPLPPALGAPVQPWALRPRTRASETCSRTHACAFKPLLLGQNGQQPPRVF